MKIKFGRDYMDFLVHEGYVEPDEIEGKTDKELEDMANNYIVKGELYADSVREDYGIE